MTKAQFDAAIIYYTSPNSDPFGQVFIHRDEYGYQTAIPVWDLLETARIELLKQEREVTAYRQLKQVWKAHAHIPHIINMLDGKA